MGRLVLAVLDIRAEPEFWLVSDDVHFSDAPGVLGSSVAKFSLVFFC